MTARMLKLITFLSIGLAVGSVAADEQSFKSAYEHYKKVAAQSAGSDRSQLVAAAGKAYSEGLAHFGEGSKNTAMLAKNYANALWLNGQGPEATQALKKAIPYFENAFGPQSSELRALLFELIGQLATLGQSPQKYIDLVARNNAVGGEGGLTRQVFLYTALADNFLRYQQFEAAIDILKPVESALKKVRGTDYEKWLEAVSDNIYWLQRQKDADWLNAEDASAAYYSLTDRSDAETRKATVHNYVLQLKNNLYLDQATRVMEQEDVELEEIYPERDAYLVNAYLLLARNILNSEQNVKKYLRKAISAAKKSIEDDPPLLGVTYRKAAGIYLENSHRQEALKMAEREAKAAVNYFEKLRATQSLPYEEGLAQMRLADVYTKIGKLDEALVALDEASHHLEQVKPRNRSLEREIHLRLVTVYSQRGLLDKATAHCLAVAQLNALAGGQYIETLYKPKPVYPKEALKDGLSGEVVFAYSVSEKGFVKDLKLVSASDPVFIEPATDALKSYRFAPRVVAGEPVTTAGATISVSFVQ